MSKTETAYYQQSTAETLKTFGVKPAFGLNQQEVTLRRAQVGLNELPSGPKFSPLKLFLSQFKDVLIIILIIAATVSLGVSLLEHGSITESLLIFFIVLAIAVVGFLNEYKAERTVEALRALISHTCRVRRDGQAIEVLASELVPGDIVLLDEGKKIPADIRIITANRLQANEASLTGESVPVSKHAEVISSEVTSLGDQRNMLFSGTLVTTGTAEGVVVTTGGKTEIGKIAQLVSSVEQEETPMQRKLDDLGKRLGLVILLICAGVFAVIFFLNRELLSLDLVQRLIFAFTAAVALAVAAIPEGLAFVVRISLALGARRMAAKNALVRKLSAVESLGSTDVVCSDKTGTLTKGEMTVRNLFVAHSNYELTGSGYAANGELRHRGKKADSNDDIQQLLEIGVLCNNAHIKDKQVLGDPTEGCLIISAAKTGLQHSVLLAANPRIREIPFTSERKMMTTAHQRKNDVLVAVKGAPDVMVKHCTKVLENGAIRELTRRDREFIDEATSLMASSALRVLGFAYKTVPNLPKNEDDLETELIFVGLQGMMDPPRIEVKQVIERVQRDAGMRVIMITGDNLETAKAVAKEIGIKGQAMTGAELESLSEAQLIEHAEKVGIYARVNPEHKIKIVRALQHHGHQVAMTGDGVNDAPAIKAADIGVAMGITGTDAAKEASDMILLDDKFLTIINAIEEGRGIYDNVRKFVNFLLSCNIGEVIVVLLGILVHGNLVLTAAQLLFINIVTDGLPAIALGSDPASKNVMHHKPQRYQQAILTKRLWTEIIIFGVLMSVMLLVQYTLGLQAQGVAAATSVVFIGMVVYEFVRLVDIRTDYKIRWFSNPWLSVSMAVSLAIQIAIIYTPPLAHVFKVQPIDAINWLFIGVGAVGLFAIMKLLNPLLDRVGPENKEVTI